MELKKESIQMLRIKNKATSQVTFDEDYNVPDVKPDIGRMVQSKAEVSMDEVRLSEGRALLKGTLNVDLLYVGKKREKYTVFQRSFRWMRSSTWRESKGEISCV